MMNYRPVFIGGLRRSGTSLMREALGRHPELAVFQNDLPYFEVFYERYRRLDLNYVQARERMIDDILAHPKMKNLTVSLERDRISSDLHERRRVDAVTVIEAFLREYARQVDRPRWGLKNPCLEFFGDVIFQRYPDAVMIHMIRDPRDRLASIKNHNWKYTLRGSMEEWLNSVNLARKNAEIYAGSYFIVRYESFVFDPEPYLHKILQASDLSFDDNVLAMNDVIGSRSSYARADASQPQGVYHTSIGRYIHHLSLFEVYVQQQVLGEEMMRWGYELLPLKLPRGLAAFKEDDSGLDATSTASFINADADLPDSPSFKA